MLDRGSSEKLHKMLTFADPVFITSGTLTRCVQTRSGLAKRWNRTMTHCEHTLCLIDSYQQHTSA